MGTRKFVKRTIGKLFFSLSLPQNPYPGEMLPLEQLRLYQWISRYKPRSVIEVGTGIGGSTFYISMALQKYGGKLYSCDPARRPPREFLDRFDGRLEFHQVESEVLISHLFERGVVPDFVLFDGPERPELASRDLLHPEPRLKVGCHFAMHDWDQAGEGSLYELHSPIDVSG